MKAYVMTSGGVFGLIAIAHVWRVVEEGARLATEPWYVLITLAALVAVRRRADASGHLWHVAPPRWPPLPKPLAPPDPPARLRAPHSTA